MQLPGIMILDDFLAEERNAGVPLAEMFRVDDAGDLRRLNEGKPLFDQLFASSDE